MKIESIETWVNNLLNIFAILLILSGLGITQYQTIDGLTFGLLNKAFSFKLHSFLWIPFTLLLAIRLYLNFTRKK
jgi:hypothetical protein